MLKMTRATLAIAALLAAGTAQAAQRTAVLDVKNVSCATCVPIVKRAIGRLAGVTSVTIAEKKGTAVATVIYDDAKVRPEALARASTQAGYPARVRTR